MRTDDISINFFHGYIEKEIQYSDGGMIPIWTVIPCGHVSDIRVNAAKELISWRKWRNIKDDLIPLVTKERSNLVCIDIFQWINLIGDIGYMVGFDSINHMGGGMEFLRSLHCKLLGK